MSSFYLNRFNNLRIQSIPTQLGFYAKTYVFTRDGPKLIQEFDFNQYILKKVIQIFFLYEYQPLIWKEKFRIVSFNINGTIGNIYFNYKAVSVHEAMDLLMRLYIFLFDDRDEEGNSQLDPENRSIEDFTNNFVSEFMNKITHSTNSKLDLLNNLKNGQFLDTDFFGIESNIRLLPNWSFLRNPQYNALVQADKEFYARSHYNIDIDIEDIFHLRFNDSEEHEREVEAYYLNNLNDLRQRHNEQLRLDFIRHEQQARARHNHNLRNRQNLSSNLNRLNQFLPTHRSFLNLGPHIESSLRRIRNNFR